MTEEFHLEPDPRECMCSKRTRTRFGQWWHRFWHWPLR